MKIHKGLVFDELFVLAEEKRLNYRQKEEKKCSI